MAYKFSLGAVPTGSLALSFQVTSPDVVPTSVQLQLTDSAEDVTLTDPLEINETAYIEWKQCALTQPVSWGETYTVAVLFDDEVVHTFPDAFELATPGKRRSPVLRQRLYEVLLTAFNAGSIAAQPYGDAHRPATIAIDVKSIPGTIIEVAPAYVESMEYNTAVSQIAQVTVPLRAYASIDNPEDLEELSSDFEEVLGYLLETSWKLNSFGLIQSEATCDSGEPEISEDRKLAIIEGSITVPMRRNF